MLPPAPLRGSAAVFLRVAIKRYVGQVTGVSCIIDKRSQPIIFPLRRFAANDGEIINRRSVVLRRQVIYDPQSLFFFAGHLLTARIPKRQKISSLSGDRASL